MTATTSSAINSAEADALFIASMHPIQQQDLLRPFSPMVNALLEKLTPSQHTYVGLGDPEYFQTDIRPILRKSGVNTTSANPSGWEDATQIIALRSILDGRETCKAAGLHYSTIAELTSTEAVLALEARIGKGWSSQRVAMILADLRRMAILADGSCNSFVGERRAFHAAEPKRDIDHRVFRPDEYLRGAYAVATMARLLQLSNRKRARSLFRNSTLLAFAAVSHLRLSEYNLLDVADVRRRYSRDGERILSVSVDMRKTGDSRIIIVRDAQIIAMLLELLNAPPETPLFRNADGSRISSRTMSEIFYQMGDLSVGELAGANILRRARLLGGGTAEERSRDLGKSPHSMTPENHYKGNLMDAGLAFVKKANAEALAKMRALRKTRDIDPSCSRPSKGP